MASDNNKRIAKNTMLLYFRQILILLVSLYTSRVLLNALGVDDYGIYNVVGSIVTMFSFITNTMATASQRFLSYDLAKNDPIRLRQTFSLVMLSYIILILIALILSEGIGVWFLNAKMNIPLDRLEAANWVLQFSIFSFVAQILAAPYMAVIISREKMDVYAYVSIVEAILKLAIIYLLVIVPIDQLKSYAALMFFCAATVTLLYGLYCKSNFPESRFVFFYDKHRFKELCSFAWWNTIGAFSNVLRSQGINILLNLFFTPAINAARGIAYQVNSAIMNFSNNFYMAVRPQIIKNYAKGELAEMHNLIFFSSRFAFYLVFVISLPILLITQPILDIWLKTPPAYTSLFVQLVVINSLLEVLSFPLVNGLQAAGKIRTYQLVVSTAYLMNLPVSYVLLKMGYPPETTMYVNIAIVVLCFIPRLLLCRKYINISLVSYLRTVLLRLFVVTVAMSFICLFVRSLFSFDSLMKVLSAICVMLVLSMVGVYVLGLSSMERLKLNSLIIGKIRNKI